MDAAETAGRTGELANAADDTVSTLNKVDDIVEGGIELGTLSDVEARQ